MNIPYEKLSNIENQLIVFVKSGQYHNFDLFIPPFPCDEHNLSEIKTYLIGFNALLKKTAEYAKVSHEDAFALSSQTVSEINALTHITDFSGILKKITVSYCKLVSSHSDFKFSTSVNRAIIKINRNLSEDLSLKALAQFNNISAGHFSGLFKKETGVTLTEYVNTKRIEYSKELLVTSNLKIKEIATICGIKDLNYFIKLFKKYENTTPKEYRENLLKSSLTE